MYFPYFKYGCSLEINTARTAAYVSNRCDFCAESIQTTLFVRDDCDILNWELDPDDGETVQPATYTYPAADAPWVDASEPESARFMGFVISNVVKPTHIGRSVGQRISTSGGGTLGVQRSNAQEFTIDVMLFACDQVAMEFGFRYLMDSLAGGGCDEPCTLCELEYRDACPTFTGTPDLDTFNTGRWILKNVGMTKAPEWIEPPIQGADFYVRKARFSIASELPWKFTCPENCVTNATFTVPTPTLGCGADFDSFFCGRTAASCAVSEPSIIGETGIIVEITAGSKPLRDIEIQIIPDERGWVCDPGSAPAGFVNPDPCDLVYIEDLPARHKLVYNTAEETVRVFTNAGVESDGTPYLTFDGLIGSPPTYPVVRCGEFCVRVEVAECSVTSGAKVTIDTQHREF